MKIINSYLLMAFMMLSTSIVLAQKHHIKGKIYDLQSRKELSGAIIKLTDHASITTSDKKGYFELNSSEDQGRLIISVLGYKTQTVKYQAADGLLNIQMETDPVALNEVRVTAYSGNRTNKETAGAIAQVSGKQIRQGSGVSLQAALNAVPGVQMDQSTLSESRISIRGNGVRSPYGLRKVKVYVNDIPVTEADGMTRIETLDVNGIGQAEIIKGPASSIYGGGTAGVINFQIQRSPYQEQSIEASTLLGSYGLKRLASTYRHGGEKLNSYVSYGWQELDGYRDHSNDMRRFLTANFQLYPSDKQTITLLINRTTQHAQIPGSITRSQMEEQPKKANEGNFEKQAGRDQNWTRIGMGQQYQFNDQFSNSTSIFTYFFDLDHPLPFAYLRNFYQSYGGRTRFNYNLDSKILPTIFSAGMEFNQALTKGTQYENNGGVEGAIRDNTDFKNTLYSIFYQSETALSNKTSLALGISYNGLNYDARAYLKPEQSGVKKFKAQASPRIALSHNFGSALSLHGSVSSGFSPPAGSEIKNVDGSVNTKLQAEKGINYEINAKGNLLKSRLAYDLAFFKMDMKGELIGQSVQQGITVYNNSGKTSHDGAELALSYVAIKADEGLAISLLRPFVAITYSKFRFKDYKVFNAQNEVEAAYDGNELTGIAPWVISAGINLETSWGLYFYGSYFFNDQTPLDDANTTYNNAYHVVNSKLGYQIKLNNKLGLDIYGGVDNLTNTSYSSLNSINAPAYGGGESAYFNPSPKRNAYAGLNIKYFF